MNKEITYVSVDSDALDFLKAVCFGAIADPYEAASSRAYRDMNRTIRFNGLPEKKRTELRTDVTTLLEREIRLLTAEAITSQSDYDVWHFEQCRTVRSIYREAGVDFHFGQSQKWLNMMIKYLYISGECSFEDVFQYLHVPLDNYIFDVAQKELGIAHPQLAWSRWDDYDKEYLPYQTKLRSRIHGLPPLRWEFKSWVTEAQNRTSE
jgi:hypothetical protein